MAILVFMLLTEWVSFSAQKAEHSSTQKTERNSHTVPAAEATPVAAASLASDSNNTLTGSSQPKTDDEDVPSVVDDVLTRTVATPEFSNPVITVDTDVIRVEIDPVGGDIVTVALKQYPQKLDAPEHHFLLLQRDEQRYYVAQSGLVGQNGIDGKGRAQFSSAKASYQMSAGDNQLDVDLVYRGEGRAKIIKRFSFRRGDYLIDLNYLVENQGAERWQANLFGQIKRDHSPDPSASSAGSIGVVPFLGTALTQADDRFTKFDFEDMAENPFTGQLPGGWIAMIQHYFLSAWVPASDLSHNYSTRVTQAGYNIGGFTSPALVVDPGQSGKIGASFYAGPKDQYRLKEISPYLDLSVDYGWLWWIAQPLFWLLINIYELVGNWGTSIILLTVLIKAAFFQLSATSYKSMANMRRVQPKMVDIKERYAEDKQKQSQAMMDLYKKEKINPLGGCLPILVQMPVFIALYWVLMESVELRQAPFYGWIKDLSVMDPYFILPLIMGASMWFQQKLNPPPPDPMQAKVMQWLPIVFTFFFLWFPAGLVLYWVANNLLSITQQWIITRQIEKAAAER